MSFSFAACGDKNDSIRIDGERHELPSLQEYDIVSVISDSGITRYRITSAELLMYDKAPEPYSFFPRGLYVERFDANYNIDASLVADKAKYFEQKDLWQLNGNVRIVNLQGEIFETEELFLDQKNDSVYTEQFIKITQPKRMITGYGLESNSSMTRYDIIKPRGEIQMEEETVETVE